MVTYQIEWKPSALHELKRLDRQMIGRIIKGVESLSTNPFPPGIKKLHGSEHTYRLRIGDYRVIYEVFTSHLVVEVVRVRHRKDVYRK
jgi:mRNA interferase RelE/StbE